MLTDAGIALTGFLALAIISMGARYLFDPQSAAAGFGIPGELEKHHDSPPWLAVKGARDVAIGVALTVLLITGAHQQLGYLMLAISLIPIADGAIVLSANGPKTIAYAVHWGTATLILLGGALLIV
ncbi:MAG TPA: DUF4267 domain-containing protein [Thermoleophilaceae bacterium]|jgi:hypothetical protein